MFLCWVFSMSLRLIDYTRFIQSKRDRTDLLHVQPHNANSLSGHMLDVKAKRHMVKLAHFI